MCLGAAVVFFFAYWIYMALTTIISPTVNLAREVCLYSHCQGKRTCKYDKIEEEQFVHQPAPQLLHLFRIKYSWGLALRQLLTVLYGIDLVAFTFMSKFDTLLLSRYACESKQLQLEQWLLAQRSPACQKMYITVIGWIQYFVRKWSR